MEDVSAFAAITIIVPMALTQSLALKVSLDRITEFLTSPVRAASVRVWVFVALQRALSHTLSLENY